MNFRLILPVALILASTVYGADPPPAEPTPDTAAAPAPMQTLPQRAETLRNQALEAQLKIVDKETETVWLGSGTESFLGLYLADHSGQPFANLLILHDNRQHPDWPGLIQTLRTEMAAHGWNTLAIAVPDYQVPTLTPAEATPGASPATSGEPSTDADAQAAPVAAPADAISPDASTPTAVADNVEYAAEEVPDILDQRVKEAVGFMKEKQANPLVIVAVGLSATIAAKKARTMLVNDIAGLVIIDPVEPASLGYKIDLDAMDLRIPVLDIAPEFHARTNPVLRRNSASRSQQLTYQQRIIRGAQQDFHGVELSVVKSIRGWGERYFK